MRDISFNKYDATTGLAAFSLANARTVSGINLLISKVTKKILSSTQQTGLFTYYGLDIKNVSMYGVAENSVDSVRTMLSANLQNVAASIQNNTSQAALPTERLSSLALSDLVYDKINNNILATIAVTPVQGDTQTLLFPLGV